MQIAISISCEGALFSCSQARTVLDAEGQKDVRLLDLRYDYVLRQLETHDWPYVLRVSGLSVTTYRNTLSAFGKEDTAAPATAQDEKENA